MHSSQSNSKCSVFTCGCHYIKSLHRHSWKHTSPGQKQPKCPENCTQTEHLPLPSVPSGPAPDSWAAPHRSLPSGRSASSSSPPSSDGTAGSGSSYWLSLALASSPAADKCPLRRTCLASRPSLSSSPQFHTGGCTVKILCHSYEMVEITTGCG